MNLTSGAHNPERETPIISPCNSVFTGQAIFGIFFALFPAKMEALFRMHAI